VRCVRVGFDAESVAVEVAHNAQGLRMASVCGETGVAHGVETTAAGRRQREVEKTIGSVGRQITREITRSIFGTLRRR